MKITDADILAVISTCHQSSDSPVRGVHVRALLKQKFGVKGGTDRVYRLMQQHQDTAALTDAVALQAALNQAIIERDQALARAELAEHREATHFDRVAVELHELRQYKARHEGQAGVQLLADREAERLRLLMDNMRGKQRIEFLEQLLGSHAIEIPKPRE